MTTDAEINRIVNEITSCENENNEIEIILTDFLRNVREEYKQQRIKEIQELSKQDRIRIMVVFIERHTKEQIAEFLVNQDEAITGLCQNNKQWVEAYKELLENNKKEVKE